MRTLMAVLVAAAAFLAGCGGAPPDLSSEFADVARLREEAAALSSDPGTAHYLEASAALETMGRNLDAQGDHASARNHLVEARAAARAAVASAAAHHQARESERCVEAAAGARQRWEDTIRMLEQTEHAAEREARGIPRDGLPAPPTIPLPPPPPQPLGAVFRPDAVAEQADAWSRAAAEFSVPYADLESGWTRAIRAAENPEAEEAVRQHQLRSALWAVHELAGRVQAEIVRRHCNRWRDQADRYAERRDQALWAMIDLERGMKDSVRRELDAERARMEDRQEALFESLQQFEGKFASIRREAHGTIMSLADILFDFDRATLRREAELNLAKVAVILEQYPEMHIFIEGHTDNVGTEVYNLELSERRARSVYTFLATQGVTEERMDTAGYGLARPVASNDTEEGRQKNRRVDLVIREASAMEAEPD